MNAHTLNNFTPCFMVCFGCNHDLTLGTARIINRQKSESFGMLYKIVPVTNNTVTNQITCFKVEGERDSPVLPQGVLPNASLYKVQCVLLQNSD